VKDNSDAAMLNSQWFGSKFDDCWCGHGFVVQ